MKRTPGMAADESSRHDLTAALRDVALGSVGPHLDADTVVAYHEDRIDPAAAEAVRQHLVGCRPCALLVLELEKPFEAQVTSAGGSVPKDDRDRTDFARAASWRAVRTELRAQPATEDRVARPPTQDAGWRFDRRTAWVMGAWVAGLAVMTVGLASQVVVLTRKTVSLERQIASIDAPQLNTPIVYLDPTTRGEGSIFQTVPPTGRVLLILTPESAEEYARYRLDVVDGEGAVLWQTAGLILSDHGTLRLAVSGALVPAGIYTLRLFGLADGDPRPVGDFAVRFSSVSEGTAP